ncbi:MAG: hypothetical protein WD025_01770 [Bacteriovoracaceae bacterium]
MKPMYCPVCFNDTLKLASSGVVKMTFNGKAKATSQFFYDLKNETSAQTYKKFRLVVEDYFSWYARFQNKDPIKDVQMLTSDFICLNKCKLGGSVQLTVLNLVIPKDIVIDTLEMYAEKYEIPLKLNPL